MKVGRLALWALAGLLVVAVVRVTVPRVGGATILLLLIYLVYGLLIVGAVRACRDAGIPIPEVIGPPPKIRDLITALLFIPLLLLVAMLSIWLTMYVLSWIAPGFVRSLLADRQGSSLVRNLVPGASFFLPLGIIVVGPVVEEFVFRGLLLRRWVARSGLWRGIFGTSLVFALLHPQFVAGAFVIGIVLALLYLATRSLPVPILVHGLMNGIVTLVAFNRDQLAMSADAQTRTLAQLQSEWGAPLIMLVVISALLAAAARPLVIRITALQRS